VLESLSNIDRDDYDGWKEYLRVYYMNFDVLHGWASLGFYRRWRRTREIKQEQLKARFKNTLLRPNATMPQPTNLARNAIQAEQEEEGEDEEEQEEEEEEEGEDEEEQEEEEEEEEKDDNDDNDDAAATPSSSSPVLGPERNIVAWGAGRFGNRRGMPPLPNESLKKYVARFARVVLIPEYNTSQICLCGRQTEPYKVSMKMV
jgi:hypothetical protein